MPKPVYALVGEDSFLQLESLAAIHAEFAADAQRVDFDGERAQLAEVLDELRSFAMFGAGGKLVVLRNADDFISRHREQLEDYLQNPSTSGTLVLRVASLPGTQRIHKLIAKIGKVIKCEPPADAKRWIAQRASTVHQISLEPDAVSLLADLIGADFGRLDNELAKLALQADSTNVTADDVSKSVAFQREQEIKDITIELATGRPDEALRRWRTLVQLDNSAEFRAVTWLSMWLEDVGQILSGAAPGKMTWKYGPRLGKFIDTAKSMGRPRYARAVNELADVDRRTKSGLGDAAQNVERFIVSFAVQE